MQRCGLWVNLHACVDMCVLAHESPCERVCWCMRAPARTHARPQDACGHVMRLTQGLLAANYSVLLGLQLLLLLSELLPCHAARLEG